jgi:hypothetical protein
MTPVSHMLSTLSPLPFVFSLIFYNQALRNGLKACKAGFPEILTGQVESP